MTTGLPPSGGLEGVSLPAVPYVAFPASRDSPFSISVLLRSKNNKSEPAVTFVLNLGVWRRKSDLEWGEAVEGGGCWFSVRKWFAGGSRVVRRWFAGGSPVVRGWFSGWFAGGSWFVGGSRGCFVGFALFPFPFSSIRDD